MSNLISRIIRWWKKRRHAVEVTRAHLDQEARPLKRFGGVWMQYRVDETYITGARHADDGLPLRTYYAVDAATGAIERISWTEVRRLVPERKTTC